MASPSSFLESFLGGGSSCWPFGRVRHLERGSEIPTEKTLILQGVSPSSTEGGETTRHREQKPRDSGQKENSMTATQAPQIAPKFFDGYYTLISPKDGAPHRTLRVRTQKLDAKVAPGKQVLGLLTGSDNENSYTNFGFVEAPEGLSTWSRHKGTDTAKIGQVLLSLLLQDRLGQNLSKLGYTVELSKRCSRCFRVLTHPESLASGIGPECAKKGVI